MADIAIFRINYKSDFILTLNSDAGWMTPFCIKFWTGSPLQAYYAEYDGTDYTHCAPVEGEPTKLRVQFDDHHLPIGDLKFQIGYHFTVADFPTSVEDEVLNQASVIIEVDDAPAQVMLDFNGDTAPDIQFSLPAYANEAQRIANEQQRIANEEQRIANEQTRIDNEALRISAEQTRQDNEAQRIRNEQTRISQEEARVREFATLKHDAQEATTAANDAATLANQKAQLAADKAQLAADKAALAQDAANLANQKAQLAADKAALANYAATLANEKAALAQQKAEYAKDQGDYAKNKGDYAKEQGDYAKRKGDDAAVQMQQQAQVFDQAQSTRQTAYEQAEGTESGSVAGDGSRWGAFKTNEAARDAKVDAKVADIINLQEAVAEGAVYDVSAKNHTAGPNNDGKWASLSALLSDANLNTLIPTSVRRGGMSIKFVHSSDNKYVQFRCMSNSFTTDTTQWAIADDSVYVENSEYVYVKTDAEDRILWAIKKDGSIYYGAGVPQQVKDYIEEKISSLSLDEYEDIVAFLSDYLESDTTLKVMIDGINERIPEIIENPEWISATTDNEGKILEGITKEGKKFIGDFCDETKEIVKRFVGDVGINDGIINIPLLDFNFTSPVPVTITGTKGNPAAKYEFELPLNEDAFNIRFKFMITENLINQASDGNNKNVIIARLGNTSVLQATALAMKQWASSETYQSESKINYWPCLRYGVRFNGAPMNNKFASNTGWIAFSIKYTGSESVATVENTGESFVLKIGQSTSTFAYSSYPTVSELYEALKQVTDIVVDYRELNNRDCTELVIFPECNIKPTMYTGITGASDAPIVEYVDAAEFMIPYAVDETWHNMEITKIGSTIYCCCDGILTTVNVTISDSTILTLGGECGVMFKNFEIHTNSSYDAEIKEIEYNGTTVTKLISSMNPYVIIYEGHGIDKVPSVEVANPGMNTTIDRLQYVFTILKSKGYVPVSIYDIAEWYNGNKELPKRCYTLIFDDYRVDHVMDIDNRSVFTKFGVKPSLALITDRFDDTDIYHNGSVISVDKAVEIARLHGFDLISHTRAHRYNNAVKPSDMLNELVADNYDGELFGVDGKILVFPGGETNPYVSACMEWMGYSLGVTIWNATFSEGNTKNRSKYDLYRYEIGLRQPLSTVLKGII